MIMFFSFLRVSPLNHFQEKFSLGLVSKKWFFSLLKQTHNSFHSKMGGKRSDQEIHCEFGWRDNLRQRRAMAMQGFNILPVSRQTGRTWSCVTDMWGLKCYGASQKASAPREKTSSRSKEIWELRQSSSGGSRPENQLPEESGSKAEEESEGGIQAPEGLPGILWSRCGDACDKAAAASARSQRRVT